MKKVILVTIALLVAASVGWAGTCSIGSLSSYLSLGPAGCTVSGNLFTSFTTSLSSSDAAGITLTPITSGSGAGGFTASVNLGALAGTSNSVNFTATAPAGSMVTDLSAGFTGGTGGSLALSLNNGSTLTATTGGGPAVVNFSGVSSLGVTGTLSAAANASGTTSLSVTPSLTPEPATLALFGTGLGVVMLLGLRRRLNSGMV